jgi:hypothetical protein
MDLKLTKITDKVRELDVKGQGCTDDCAAWSGSKASDPAGCTVVFSCNITCWW